MLLFIVCCVRQNFYEFILCCNPDLNGQIYDCVLVSMAAVQAEDMHNTFVMGDLNSDHQGVAGFGNHESSWCSAPWYLNFVWIIVIIIIIIIIQKYVGTARLG